MSGAFSCSPNLCPACSRDSTRIQLKRHPSEWGAAADEIPDEQRAACVKEYLRGIYARAIVAKDAKRKLDEEKARQKMRERMELQGGLW